MNKHLRIKVGWLIAIGLVFGAGAATAGPDETKLVGTLTIDFNVPDANPTIPAGFEFTVAKDTHYSLYDPNGSPIDLSVPKVVRGGTFELNELCDNATAQDTTAGGSQLRVSQTTVRGSLFRALVTSGAFFCLVADGATRVDDPFDDPFLGNADLGSLAGERGIWLAQILNSAEDPAVEVGVDTLRDFFEIPAASTIVEPSYRTVEVSSFLNRGGSADGVVNKDIILKFKQP